jgi:lysozyme
MIKPSSACLSIIKQYENLELNAYPDPGTKAEPITIGYGTTVYADGRKVRMGDTITAEQAEFELKHHVEKKVCVDLTKLLQNINFNQNQIDSLISLVYNIGIGAFKKSTLLKKIKANDIAGAAEQFKVWNQSAGKVLAGLAKRRNTEYQLFIETKSVIDVIIKPDKTFDKFVFSQTTNDIIENKNEQKVVQSQSVVVDPPPKPGPSRPTWKYWR